MKRTHKIITKFTLRDEPDGACIHAARVAAAKADQSINTWLLDLIQKEADKTAPESISKERR